MNQASIPLTISAYQRSLTHAYRVGLVISCIAVFAPEVHCESVAEIENAWNTLRIKAGAYEYVMDGTSFTAAGGLGTSDAGDPIPPLRHTQQVRMRWIVDVARQSIRREYTMDIFHGDENAYRSTESIYVFSDSVGKEMVPFFKSSEERRQSVTPRVEFYTSGPKMQLMDWDRPVLIAHGCFPPVDGPVVERLNVASPLEGYTFQPTRIAEEGLRLLTLQRPTPTGVRESYHELCVDPAMEYRVVRYRQFSGANLRREIALQYGKDSNGDTYLANAEITSFRGHKQEVSESLKLSTTAFRRLTTDRDQLFVLEPVAYMWTYDRATRKTSRHVTVEDQSLPGGPCCIGQQAPSQSQDKEQPKKQADVPDLGELSKELDAATPPAADDNAAAAEAMELYESRAKQEAIEARDRLLKDPRWKPTHKQVNRLAIPGKLNNMCLDAEGRILACCGDEKIRVFSADGKLQTTYSLDFVPEAISMRLSDGTIFVGGQGQLARLDSDGKLQKKVAFPPPPSGDEKKAIVDRMLKEEVKQLQQMALGVKKQLDEVKKELAKAPPADEESKKIKAMSEYDVSNCIAGVTMTEDRWELTFNEGTSTGVKARVLEQYLATLGGADVANQREALEQQVRSQADQLAGSATYTGLAVADKDLFVICSGPGYTYNAWRITPDFDEPKMILSGLRGCCGQMDCQTHDGRLWLAMNSQHKVQCYDRDGKQLSEFGKEDREAADGFGGCCEPKNLRFSQDGKFVYAAQSGPPVCVKRFTLDGVFQDVVCFPICETGCVRVSVDVHESTFFLMNPDESAIYVFQPE
jgi:hypothetical protein